MNPTDEQIKEFWGWCGWNCGLSPPKVCELGSITYYYKKADGTEDNRFDGYPPIDLNNLFRYAVPKLNNPYIGFYQDSISIWCIDNGGDCLVAHSENKNPALALFWAIYETLGGKVC